MDYNYLKDMLLFMQRNSSTPLASTPKGSLKRRVALYNAISGVTVWPRGSLRNNEDGVVILVLAEEKEGSEGLYNTMFLRSSVEGEEQELVSFHKLDNEFNKVNSFYKKKVNEVMEEADELSKQMNALIALQVKVDKGVWFNCFLWNVI